MVRNDYWNFDQDLEGVRSLGAVLDDASFVLPRRGMRLMLDLNQFRGCKGLQPSKVNVVFQGGMASVPSHFSLCYKGLLIYGTGRSVQTGYIADRWITLLRNGWAVVNYVFQSRLIAANGDQTYP